MGELRDPDLELVASVEWPPPEDRHRPEYQDALKRAARACRRVLQGAVDRFEATAKAGPMLLVFDDLERRCAGDWGKLGTLLRVGDENHATTQELWFAVGRGAVVAGRSELAVRVGRQLVEQGGDIFADPYPRGLPPRIARGLHLLALATPGLPGEDYARQAADAYRRAHYAPPADLLERGSATRSDAGPDGRRERAVRPTTSAGGQMELRELAELLRHAGETDRSGKPIGDAAVRSRLRRSKSSPDAYGKLARLRDPRNGRFPRAETITLVGRIAESTRCEREAQRRTAEAIRGIPPTIVGGTARRSGPNEDED
ncbi:MAG: hypothetical protein HMLKMBBP_02521 [Planctomycetes bacterium]|nr:hypothetical protein [Planctomycetota bacterium]